MYRLIPGIAVLLAYAIAPGAGELTENVAHFVLDGHAAHGQHEAEEAPSRDAHGCSGPFQTCPCHGTTAFVADSGPIEIGVAEYVVRRQPRSGWRSDWRFPSANRLALSF
ncbi:MAG: hypothetical protein JRF48_09090 [Deltaproteobacteria bacterium]|nr:hypothetical protein [Deltaproteobacteria bacterium]